MKQLVINADDLGICEASNVAIAEAYRHGVLTSASLMACGPAFEHAVQHVVEPHPGLAVGLHLCLTSGRSVLAAEQIPLLVDDQGRFRHGFLALLRASRRAEARTQIRRELEAQFARLETHGVTISHIDSHRHIHMIPAVFAVVTELALRRNGPRIRVADEPPPRWSTLGDPRRWPTILRNFPKKLVLTALARTLRARTLAWGRADRTFGILDSGSMHGRVLASILARAADGITEVITHPGGERPQIAPEIALADQKFLRSPNRHAEYLALVDPDLRQRIGRLGYSLAKGSELAPGHEPAGRGADVACVRAGTVSPRLEHGTAGRWSDPIHEPRDE
jgi:predicted glycoside hydrolase/deacetylase ChbG (UPF0249 family)